MQKYVINNKLNEFNEQAIKKNPKFKKIKKTDDFGRMKERTFIEIMDEAYIINKSLANNLKESLGRRNSCGHPSSFSIGESAVLFHLESLIENVYKIYN